MNIPVAPSVSWGGSSLEHIHNFVYIKDCGERVHGLHQILRDS